MSTTIAGATPLATTPIPRQNRYIIGNEGCERCSFHGLRNIRLGVPKPPPRKETLHPFGLAG